MNWDEARQQHPNQWLLVEAIQAHSQGEHRILDQLAVIQVFADAASALQAYQALHAAEPQRELYVVHSSRATIEITERPWLGVRVGR